MENTHSPDSSRRYTVAYLSYAGFELLMAATGAAWRLIGLSADDVCRQLRTLWADSAEKRTDPGNISYDKLHTLLQLPDGVYIEGVQPDPVLRRVGLLISGENLAKPFCGPAGMPPTQDFHVFWNELTEKVCIRVGMSDDTARDLHHQGFISATTVLERLGLDPRVKIGDLVEAVDEQATDQWLTKKLGKGLHPPDLLEKDIRGYDVHSFAGEKLLGRSWDVTIKDDIVPNGKVYLFTDPQFLGKQAEEPASPDQILASCGVTPDRPISVEEAVHLDVCRICRQKPVDLVMNFGTEFACRVCLDKETN